MRSYQLYISLFLLTILICCNSRESNIPEHAPDNNLHFSLGQWCYNEQLFDSTMSSFDFVDKAAELGFDGVEYVNQFFMDKREDLGFLDSLSQHTIDSGMTNSMLLVDQAGNLAASDPNERKEALTNHKLWVNACSMLRCPAMRINVYGDGEAESRIIQAKKTMLELLDYSASNSVKILIENHGGLSNDADWLKLLYDTLDHDNLALVIDFDNWCIEFENGQLWGKNCIKEYSRYDGMQKLIAYADNISVKAFEFDDNGKETKTDFARMAQIIKQSDYNGKFGIEFEGHTMNIDSGIIMTRNLIENYLSDGNE